ncbi:DNA polymerase Y family protein [Nocardioides terrisoli]|uniref:DNA polymerase Y family protein n=1 Tax=Nocardioides terrisoli TaxID=3388267 RepID=UPI00287BBE1F|nr:DNA polymerase Y family protein [Nocardioides marmorisolisilvae]
MSPRVLVVWCPDWPVVAALAEEELSRQLPAAVFARNRVVAGNAAARAEGVRRGMRRRDAQARCPGLVVCDADPARDLRAFEPVLAAVERLRPGVAPLRPGLLAVRSPGRFYGGDEHAAAVLTQELVEQGVWDVRTGVADDLFTAEQAARQAGVQDCVVVPEGGAADFLRGLPLEVLADGPEGAEMVGLLRRLGLGVLGDLAALPAGDVLNRFGRHGARLHRLVRGDAPAPLPTRTPPPELACEIAFEPPLESAEAVCFSVRRTAERFVAQLGERDLVCTVVDLAVETDRGTVTSRRWAHARWFGAADLVDRVHWQLQAVGPARTSPPGHSDVLDGPVARVRFAPETVEPAGDHADALWGGGTDDRVERGIARVQAMIGYDAACRPVRQGGRAPADRQALVPWGSRPTGLRSALLPWPGSVPPPAPTRVFAEPAPAAVVDLTGRPVRVSDRGVVSSPPARFTPGTPYSREEPVAAWAGPWPVEELWWESGGPAQLVARFQLVGADGRAWLLRVDAGGWWTEASYD